MLILLSNWKNETLDFYLGFQLDGVETYKNLSATAELKQFSKITVYSEVPEISKTDTKFAPFRPNCGDKIHIKVGK